MQILYNSMPVVEGPAYINAKPYASWNHQQWVKWMEAVQRKFDMSEYVKIPFPSHKIKIT